MAPAALTYTYATEADLQAFVGVSGETGRVDDDNSGVIDGLEPGYITSALSWATAKVNLYCLKRYKAADLATDWTVNNWTVILACYWLSCRRGNPAPGSFNDLYKETLEDLKAVGKGQILLDLAARASEWPAWSNVRVNIFKQLKKVQVERPISDRGTAGLGQAASIDREADLLQGVDFW